MNFSCFAGGPQAYEELFQKSCVGQPPSAVPAQAGKPVLPVFS